MLKAERTVHYKKGRQMGEGYFVVEVSSTHDTLYITAFNVERAQSLLIEIKQPQAKEVLDKFEFDFDQLAQCLRVEEDRFILLNPFYETIVLKSNYEDVIDIPETLPTQNVDDS